MEIKNTQNPLFQIRSKTKTHAYVEFYSDYFKYQALGEHSPKCIRYADVDKITRNTNRKFLLIYAVFILLLTLANIIMYHESSIWNRLTNLSLILLVIFNYMDTKRILKVKHGPLESEIFISSKPAELTKVIDSLKRFQADCAIG